MTFRGTGRVPFLCSVLVYQLALPGRWLISGLGPDLLHGSREVLGARSPLSLRLRVSPVDQFRAVELGRSTAALCHRLELLFRGSYAAPHIAHRLLKFVIHCRG